MAHKKDDMNHEEGLRPESQKIDQTEDERDSSLASMDDEAFYSEIGRSEKRKDLPSEDDNDLI